MFPKQWPNPFVEAIKRTAALRGQHANRIELRDPDDKWPSYPRVSYRDRCAAAAGLAFHEPREVKQEVAGGERVYWDPFCRCGALVTGRRPADDERGGAEEGRS